MICRWTWRNGTVRIKNADWHHVICFALVWCANSRVTAELTKNGQNKINEKSICALRFLSSSCAEFLTCFSVLSFPYRPIAISNWFRIKQRRNVFVDWFRSTLWNTMNLSESCAQNSLTIAQEKCQTHSNCSSFVQCHTNMTFHLSKSIESLLCTCGAEPFSISIETKV